MATRRATRGALNVDAIVDAAIVLIEAEGVEKASMARVAAALDVSTMALYRHVASKRELLNAVADRYLAEIELPDGETLDWRGAIVAGLSAIYRAFHAHPPLEAIMARQQLDAVMILHVSDFLLAALKRAGLDDRDAVRALNALHSYGMGYTQRKSEFRRGDATAARRLSLQLEFEDGLEFLLDGIEARIRASA